MDFSLTFQIEKIKSQFKNIYMSKKKIKIRLNRV